MNGPFYIGATGLSAEQRALDAVANNIANINTPGFKRARVQFSELLGGAASQGAGITQSSPAFSGVQTDISGRDFTQGDLKQTGKPLDVAIDGEGFLELMGPGGRALLWRGGSMKVNADGYLATMDGLPLKAMISAPLDATAVSIAPDGKVMAQMSGQSGLTVLGQIDLVRAKSPSTLTNLGDGFYEAANPSDLITATPGEDGAGLLATGALESSNVELSDEMVTLLMLQRAYAANAQVVQAGDELMAIANGLRR